MKTRLGFVTNSSSSSFIVAFQNEQELDSLQLIDGTFRYALLHDEDVRVSIDDALSNYACFRDFCIEEFIQEEVLSEDDTKTYSDWKNENPEEYKKKKKKLMKEKYYPAIEDLKNFLKDKEVICLFSLYDECEDYDYFAHLAESRMYGIS